MANLQFLRLNETCEGHFGERNAELNDIAKLVGGTIYLLSSAMVINYYYYYSWKGILFIVNVIAIRE